MTNGKKLLTLILSLLLAGTAACGLFPDRSREYQQSESLPDLEIPPDLTRDAISDRMAIPGERNRTANGTAPEDQPASQTP